MAFRLGHHQLRRLVDRVVGPVPVDNRSIDAAADHVVNLTFDLRRVRLAVTDIHVARIPEPKNHVGINLRRSAGIKQGVHVHLTYVARASIVIRLCLESVCRAGIVRGQSRECRGGYHVRRAGQTESRRKQRDCDCRKFAMHRSSGRR
jgi:hypothetical protein